MLLHESTNFPGHQDAGEWLLEALHVYGRSGVLTRSGLSGVALELDGQWFPSPEVPTEVETQLNCEARVVARLETPIYREEEEGGGWRVSAVYSVSVLMQTQLESLANAEKEQ